jgi:prophage antirepressor-like protein
MEPQKMSATNGFHIIDNLARDGVTTEPAPVVFLFDQWRVRVVVRDHKPWFVAKDIAEALGYTWNGSARIEHVPQNWRGVTSVVTPSGTQEMAILSLEGLFHFLNRSDKPAVAPFQEWVNGTVLVSIHEKGEYKAPAAPEQPKPPRASAAPRLPAGIQLHELRMIYGSAAAKRLDYLIGYEAGVSLPEEGKAPPAIAEAAFQKIGKLFDKGARA